MRTEKPPLAPWPHACNGSLCSWLMFIGPSPGGERTDPTATRAELCAGHPLWNEDYEDPFRWSNGFKKSMRPLVEVVTGRSKAQGADRVFGVINFDWVNNPEARNVSQARMDLGQTDVIAVLQQTQPRVIVPMERRSYDQLKKALEKQGYSLRPPQGARISIPITKSHKHTALPAYKIADRDLSGSVVIKCPQHPARIYNEEYAARCARAIRSALEQLANGKAILEIDEPLPAERSEAVPQRAAKPPDSPGPS